MKSIKQRKKKKAHKRKRESGKPSEKSGKKKRRKVEAEGCQPIEPAEIDQGPTITEPAPAIPEEPPHMPTVSPVDYPDEERSRDPTPDKSTLPSQSQLVDEIRAPTAPFPLVSEPSRSTVQTEAGRKISSIDQIVMLTKQLLEPLVSGKRSTMSGRKRRSLQRSLPNG